CRLSGSMCSLFRFSLARLPPSSTLFPYTTLFRSVHADTIHGSGDPEEVLVEFGGELLVDRVVQRELQRDLQHALTVERHPRRAVGLLEVAACGQRGAAVEDADVVEPEKPPLEDVLAVTVLAIDPPREVHQKLLEAFFQKR